MTPETSSTFDGALEMVKEARDRGLRVHAWIEVTLAAAAGELPASRDHVLYQHPEWLMVPRELAPEILKIDARSPAYLGRLTRWVRANTPRVDGVYVSPLAPEATAYLVTAVTAAAQRYAVDGVFLDAMRFPGADFDYSRHAMDIFRAETRPQLSPEERTRLDEVESIDPFGYAEEFPDRWRQFRQSRLTNLMSRVRKAIAAVRPALVVSAGVAPDPAPRLPSHSRTGPVGWRPGWSMASGVGPARAERSCSRPTACRPPRARIRPANRAARARLASRADGVDLRDGTPDSAASHPGSGVPRRRLSRSETRISRYGAKRSAG